MKRSTSKNRRMKNSTPRKAAVEKAQARKAQALAAGKQAGQQTLIAQVISEVNRILNEFRSAITNDQHQLMRIVGNCFQNQNNLAKSAQDNDDQFAVLLRLTILRMNQIIGLQNLAYHMAVAELPEEKRPPHPEAHMIPNITYEEVQQLFLDYAKFRERPDFRDHFRAWYTGADLSTLPPPPEVKEEAQAVGSAPEAEPEAPYPEGAQIFGGDYGSENGNGSAEAQTQRTEEEAATPSEVPEMRGIENGIENASGNDQAGAVVPGL